MLRGQKSVSVLAGAAALAGLMTPPVVIAQTHSASHLSPSNPAVVSPADAAILRKALDLYDQGDLGHAEPLLRDLVTRYPKNFEASEALGSLYAESGNLEHALPFLELASVVAPDQAIGHANLGAAYLKLGRNEDAARELKKAATLDPISRATESNLGQALLALKEPIEAAKAFGVAVSIEPENWDLRYNWAAALLDAGETTQASQAISPVPDQESQPQIQALLGDIAEKQGRFQDAVEHLQAAAKMDPSEPNLYFLGLEFLKHWTFEPAIKIFEYGLKQYPTSERMLVGMGIARYAMNDLALAAPIFAQLLDMNPESAMYADLLGRSCSLMPDMSKGCEKLEGFAEKHPKNATVATYAAASILHRSNHPEDLAVAEKLLDQAIALDPKLAEAHFQKGVLDQYQTKWKESIPELETAVLLKPESSKAHYRLALAYSHTGEREKAQEQIGLQKRYSEQEKNVLDARLKEVRTFLVTEP